MDEAVVKDILAKNIETNKGKGSITQLSDAFVIRSFFEGIKDIPDTIFHLVEIDPPYAIDLKKSKMSEGESQYQLEDYNEVDKSTYMDGDGKDWLGMREALKQSYRTMVEHSWLICWFGPEPWFGDIHRAIIEAGFKTTRMCGIWTKRSGQTKQRKLDWPTPTKCFSTHGRDNQPSINKDVVISSTTLRFPLKLNPIPQRDRLSLCKNYTKLLLSLEAESSSHFLGVGMDFWQHKV